MKWFEVSVTIDGEAAEAVVELFNRHSQGRAVVEVPVDCFEYEMADAPAPSTVIVKTYLPVDGTTGAARRRLEEGLWHLQQIYPMPDPTVRELAEEDWAEAWKQQYHTLRIGQNLVIVPVWDEFEPEPDNVVIRLEPGMAFGTGLHPTTRLCLQALEQHFAPGSTVLDVGTGSGVLAIAAAKLGASTVLALDADQVAVSVANENVAINEVADRVVVRHGSLPGGDVVPRHFNGDGALDLLESGQFDVVLVNILAPVITGMAPALKARLAARGQLICAGLIESQERDVVDALNTVGLSVIERAQEKDWVSLVVQRGE